MRGDWSPSPEGGWQHPLPEPPPGLLPGTVSVWSDWFRAWWAGNWSQDDLPVLRLTIRLYDRVMKGDIGRLAELRQWLDSAGLTFKGRQDRRWQPPPPPRPQTALERIRAGRGGPYDHLRNPDDPSHRPMRASERFAALTGEDGRPRFDKERFAVLEADARGVVPRSHAIHDDIDD